jgi:hypothetical protein
MAQQSESAFHVLIVAADEHVGLPLEREIESRASGRTPSVRVVAPALAGSAFEHAAGAVDEGREAAQDRLEEVLEDIEGSELDVEVEGQVGDADPILAIEDALFDFPADEIIVVTHADDDEARWMEEDLFEKARKRFEQPISHFVVGGSEVRPAGESGAGRDESSQDEVSPDSKNLPKLSKRDVAGIVFAVIGSFALWIIATSNPDTTRQDFDFDAFHLLIAGAVTLVNLAHVVGLMLFEAVGYRGLGQRAFANLSLYGTAAGLAVSLLLILI